MVKNTKMTTKEAYRAAVLEVIEFSAEDIVTASAPTAIVPNGKGENLSDNESDFDWWN
jgi:hypothetical protein